MYVAHESPYFRCFCHKQGAAHQVNELDGCQNAWTRAITIGLMEKHDKTGVSKECWYPNLIKKVPGDIRILHAAAVLAHLQLCQ